MLSIAVCSKFYTHQFWTYHFEIDWYCIVKIL